MTLPAGASPISTVYSWGSFANGATTSASVTRPTALPALPGSIAQIATSNSDTYALLTDATVWATGLGARGALGNGAKANSLGAWVQVHFPAGVTIDFLPNPMPYDTGFAHATDNQMYGWGFNSFNQLCLTKTSILLPTALPLSGVTMAAGAGYHALYLQQGALVACGGNGSGQLGNGTTQNSSTPVTVVGLPTQAVTAVTASWSDSGALMADGSYYDWGFNASGQLGNGTTVNSALPVQVHLSAQPVQVALGGSNETNGQSLARFADGTVAQWGGTKVHLTPWAVPGVTNAAQVASGGGALYVLDTGGVLADWGQNGQGQLGNGTKVASKTPKAVFSGLTSVSSTANNVAAY
jgi:alpha-tubulin suppressor-like RCC1 family protein